MRKVYLLVTLLGLPVWVRLSAQGSFTTTSGASVRVTGAAHIKLHNTHWNNGGVFAAGGSTVEVSGSQVSGSQIAGAGTDVFNHLKINRSAGNVTLQKDIAVNQSLVFSAGLFDLGGYDVTLNQPGGTLSGENENSRIFSTSTGEVKLTLGLNAPNQQNPGALGAVITSAANLGATTIRRGHFSYAGACDGSIRRYFVIEPANNTGLNATLRFYYFDAELNGVPENDLALYRSDDGGASWTLVGYDTRNATENWVEKTGINSCSMWTLACHRAFGGTIQWSDDLATPVQQAAVNITGSANGSSQVDAYGNYTLLLPVSSGNFTIKPVKNTNRLNGVTVGDALAIQQHLTNINLISDTYKMIAADVNRSNTLSTLDALLLKQCLLSNPAANNIFNVFWRFVPQSWTPVLPPWGFPEQIDLTGVSSHQSGLDFYGVKIGDVVNGDANPANFGAGDPLVFRVQDRVPRAGETVEAEFRADQMDDVAALQFALQFDPAALQFEGVDMLGGLPVSMDNFGLFNISEGEIRVVWGQEKGVALAEAAPVFRLKFTVLESGRKLSEVMKMNEEALPGRVYNSVLAESGVALRFGAVSGTDVYAGWQLALRAHPNPFSAATTIEYFLPGPCEAQLRVFDASGRELWRTNKSCPAGWNAETVRLNGLSAPGVLYYELTTPFGTRTERMARMGN